MLSWNLDSLFLLSLSNSTVVYFLVSYLFWEIWLVGYVWGGRKVRQPWGKCRREALPFGKWPVWATALLTVALPLNLTIGYGVFVRLFERITCVCYSTWRCSHLHFLNNIFLLFTWSIFFWGRPEKSSLFNPYFEPSSITSCSTVWKVKGMGLNEEKMCNFLNYFVTEN